jgi:hypothetical protein
MFLFSFFRQRETQGFYFLLSFVLFEAPSFLTKDKNFPLVCDSVFRSMTGGNKPNALGDIRRFILEAGCSRQHKTLKWNIPPSQFLILTLSFFIFEVEHAVGQLVEALRYKQEGRGFDSRWCHWNFSLT